MFDRQWMLTTLLHEQGQGKQQSHQDNDPGQLNPRLVYRDIRRRLDGMACIVMTEAVDVHVTMDISDMILNVDIMCEWIGDMVQMIVVRKQRQ